MLKRILLLALVAAVPAIAVAAKDPPTQAIKNAKARRAVAAYQQAVAQADAERERRAAAERKKLSEELEDAQVIATKAGDLEDAVRIRDLRTSLQPGGDRAAASRGKLRVLCAFYGQNVSWLDVTEKVTAAVGDSSKWSTVVDTKNLGDPFPGWGGTRSLIVRYEYEGRVSFKVAYQGKELSLP